MQIMNEQHVNTVNSLTDQVKRLKQTIQIFNRNGEKEEKQSNQMKSPLPVLPRRNYQDSSNGKVNYSSELDRKALVERNRQLRDEIEKVYMENLRLKKEEDGASRKSKKQAPDPKVNTAQNYNTLSLSKEASQTTQLAYSNISNISKFTGSDKEHIQGQIKKKIGRFEGDSTKNDSRKEPNSNESYKLTSKRSDYDNFQVQRFDGVEIRIYEEDEEDGTKVTQRNNIEREIRRSANEMESEYSKESGLDCDYRLSKSKFIGLNEESHQSYRTMQRQKRADEVIDKISEFEQSNKSLKQSNKNLKHHQWSNNSHINMPETEVIKQQTNEELREEYCAKIGHSPRSVMDFESRMGKNDIQRDYEIDSYKNSVRGEIVKLQKPDENESSGFIQKEVSQLESNLLISQPAILKGRNHHHQQESYKKEKDYSGSSQKMVKKEESRSIDKHIKSFRESDKDIVNTFDEAFKDGYVERLESIHENLINKIVNTLYSQFKQALRQSIDQQTPCTLVFQDKMSLIKLDEDTLLTSLAENYKEYSIIFNQTNYKKIEKEIEYQLKYDMSLIEQTIEEEDSQSSRILSKNEMLYNATSALFENCEYTLVNLFRYLGLKHRSNNVFKGSAYFIAPKMEKILGVAVCENLVKYLKLQ